MRIYQAPAGKLEELNKLLREQAVPFFKKHDMEVVGFWIPTDKESGAENKVIYLLAHKDRTTADKNWAAFRADPEWRKAMKAAEANGKLTEKVESIFLGATDYSAMK